MSLLFLCGVCKTEIDVHTERKPYTVKCGGCGRHIPIERASPTLTTARCECGTTVILDGQGEWSFYPNKTPEEAVKLFMQNIEEKKFERKFR